MKIKTVFISRIFSVLNFFACIQTKELYRTSIELKVYYLILLLNREKGIKNLKRFIAHVHGVSESIDGVGGGCFASGLMAGLNCGLRVTSGDVRSDFCCGNTVAAETLLICCNRR